jgi:hypothetical protein
MLITRLVIGVAAPVAFGAPMAFAPEALAAAGRPIHTLAGNRLAARHDAKDLLGRVRLPSGAARLSSEPRGDGGWLKPELALDATTARAEVHGWWRVTSGPDAVFAFIQAHPPRGAKVVSTGSGSSPSTSSEFVTFGWRPVAGVLRLRELAVTVTGLPGGATGVLAQAEADWIVPRRPSERVPAGVHEVDVTSAGLDGSAKLTGSITSPAKVRRVIARIDALPVVQPVSYGCPNLSADGARRVSLSFRTRTGARALARATYIAYAGMQVSGPCNPIDFSIRGRPQVPLTGADLATLDT